MSDLPAGYRLPREECQPPFIHAPYVGTRTRGPRQAPIRIRPTLSELTGPTVEPEGPGTHLADLTAVHTGEPIGERIIVSGRVLDDRGRPVAGTLVEIWQCNAAGRYRHDEDRHDAPLDPNFTGEGRLLTDPEGRYTFKTIRPGAYPWRNHWNAWRPPHIHLSLFGPAFATRLVTQMYFPGDPLLVSDPIFNSVADVRARNRLVSSLDVESGQPEYALGYRFDVVLRGRDETPLEAAR